MQPWVAYISSGCCHKDLFSTCYLIPPLVGLHASTGCIASNIGYLSSALTWWTVFARPDVSLSAWRRGLCFVVVSYAILCNSSVTFSSKHRLPSFGFSHVGRVLSNIWRVASLFCLALSLRFPLWYLQRTWLCSDYWCRPINKTIVYLLFCVSSVYCNFLGQNNFPSSFKYIDMVFPHQYLWSLYIL